MRRNQFQFAFCSTVVHAAGWVDTSRFSLAVLWKCHGRGCADTFAPFFFFVLFSRLLSKASGRLRIHRSQQLISKDVAARATSEAWLFSVPSLWTEGREKQSRLDSTRCFIWRPFIWRRVQVRKTPCEASYVCKLPSCLKPGASNLWNRGLEAYWRMGRRFTLRQLDCFFLSYLKDENKIKRFKKKKGWTVACTTRWTSRGSLDVCLKAVGPSDWQRLDDANRVTHLQDKQKQVQLPSCLVDLRSVWHSAAGVLFSGTDFTSKGATVTHWVVEVKLCWQDVTVLWCWVGDNQKWGKLCLLSTQCDACFFLHSQRSSKICRKQNFRAQMLPLHSLLLPKNLPESFLQQSIMSPFVFHSFWRGFFIGLTTHNLYIFKSYQDVSFTNVSWTKSLLGLFSTIWGILDDWSKG